MYGERVSKTKHFKGDDPMPVKAQKPNLTGLPLPFPKSPAIKNESKSMPAEPFKGIPFPVPIKVQAVQSEEVKR